MANDGFPYHVNLPGNFSADDLDSITKVIKHRSELEAQRMPDEAAALKIMFEAYQRLKALGFHDATYCPADGQFREFIEPGSTGIHRGYRDASGVWIAEAGDLWPSKPILYRDPSASAMEARRAGTQGGPVHDSAVREAKALHKSPTLTEGDTPIPLPNPFAGITPDPRLLEALKRAAAHEMTPAEMHAQRRSWIIGEMGIERPELSREQLEALADHAAGPAPHPSPETGTPHPDPRAGD